MEAQGKIFITNSFKATQELGIDFARSLKRGDIVALYGDLGSGKTTFVQGLAEGLGIKNRIISPTFIILRTYRIKNHESRIMNFYHIDLYRIQNEKEIEGLGIEQILNDLSNIVVIEWAERLGKLMPKKRWEIRFEYLGENKREIKIWKKQ